MSTANKLAPSTAAAPAPLVIRRMFAAPRALVFAAWSSSDHLKRWFCPAGFSVPEAEIEFRVGGAFNLCMRSPQGDEHWMRGRYLDIESPHRLTFEVDVSGGRDRAAPILFHVHTSVSFAEQDGGTLLEVTQHYSRLLPQAEAMIGGAKQGWGQTLDRLEQEVARSSQSKVAAASGVQSDPIERSVVHSTFRIERTYPASATEVYRALTDPVAKAKWFTGGEGFTLLERRMDVRPGGRERLQGRWAPGTHRAEPDAEGRPCGVVSTFDAVYLDVIPEQRLVYAYEMHLDDRKISASLATLELQPASAGTRLIVTEQGAFLDGFDDAGSREHGTGQLLEALGRSLEG